MRVIFVSCIIQYLMPSKLEVLERQGLPRELSVNGLYLIVFVDDQVSKGLQ